MQPWIVLKFGGTSVTGLKNWKNILQIIKKKSDEFRLIIVCSAISGVSDKLENLAKKASSGADFSADWQAFQALHHTQATEMGLASESVIGDLLSDLQRLLNGAAAIEEVSPSLWARILSAGELLSTRLGAAWLQNQGLSAQWHDARTTMQANGGTHYSATCDYSPDPKLAAQLQAQITITQGFIGRNERGQTVLLGRGGSDTSASYFAAKIQAERLEIWTDVPGLFSANPKLVPDAQLLWRLNYAEAQEMATTGAKALHPRCIRPVREYGIPLHIRCTHAPELEGTIIHQQAESPSGIKSISIRKGVALFSMETIGMWQQVGFLSNVFAVFANNDISVDMVTTSETNVTVSVDTAQLDTISINKVLHELSQYCRPNYVDGLATISLVGRKIRSILHRLGPVFERFADHKVHLLSQASSDLNFSFVVAEDQAASLVKDLHSKLFSAEKPKQGPTWSSLFSSTPKIAQPWWYQRRDELIQIAQQSTPTYVYSQETLLERAQNLLALQNIDRVFFATKANPYPAILELFDSLGLGFECVSPAEVLHLRQVLPNIAPQRILFTPNFAPKEEYAWAIEQGIHLTLDAIYPLIHWPEIFRHKKVIVRVDPGQGKGHHRYVVTAGNESKFGIPPADFPQLLQIAKDYEIQIIGLHAHTGSGIDDTNSWQEKAEFLLSLTPQLPDLQVLNLGGGFAVPYRPGEQPVQLQKVDTSLQDIKSKHPHLSFWIEPGRYLVAEAGVLLGTISQIKKKGERYYVGSNIGMHNLIRPALYGSYHAIHSLSRLHEPKKIIADIVGPICESGDVMGRGRAFPISHSGDILLIDTAGAYGQVMSSQYNLRAKASEQML